jgi:hypothetical protein
MMLSVHIGGMLLPEVLVSSLFNGSWGRTIDMSRFRRLFGNDVVDPSLYSLAGIISESSNWCSLEADALAEYSAIPGSEGVPGVIDPRRSLLIGDIGPDMPIALDYRAEPKTPSVVFLPPESGWRNAASSAEQLVNQLCK